MKLGPLCIIGVAGLTAGLLYGHEESVATRLKTSSDVLTEIMAAPDSGIPQELLEKSQCIVIVPGLKKAAFIVGAKYGRGFISCRSNAGTGWSSPAGVKVEGGSFGFQIGGSETDAIMLVMNKRGAEKLLSSKFTLGADASVAAGPVSRSSAADTDLKLQAEILTYSRSRGVFAGVALNGATLRPDKGIEYRAIRLRTDQQTNPHVRQEQVAGRGSRADGQLEQIFGEKRIVARDRAKGQRI